MGGESLDRLQSGEHEIAVKVREGTAPSIVWMGGLRSDMEGTKALALDAWGARTGRRVVRFDYRGHGAADGAFEAFVLSDWLEDARLVMEREPEERVAVGSSMGAWIALLLAKEAFAAGRPFAGLVLIAPAADFTDRLLWPQLPSGVQKAIEENGQAEVPSPYGEPWILTRRLFDDGAKHSLYGEAPIEVGCAVHILQGAKDAEVPYEHALELVQRLAHDDVVVTLVKDGDHRLSREADIARLITAVEEIAQA